MEKIVMGVLIVMLSMNIFAKKGEVTVLAAASLTEVVDELAREYDSVKVYPSYGGSQTLAFQIEQGVEADVFLSANKNYVFKLRDEGLLVDERKFAKNRLVIAVSKYSRIKTFEDFLGKNYDLGTANKSVPVGAYGDRVLSNIEEDYSGSKKEVYSRVVSESLNVKDLVTKVEIDAVDLAMVYATDIKRDRVDVIEIPEKYNVVTEYYLGVVEESRNKKEAEKFIDYIVNGDGRKVLERYGFQVN